MKVGIAPSATKKESQQYVKPIAEFLQSEGVKVYIDSDSQDTHDLPVADKNILLDVLITLGGDGTLLFYRKKYHYLKDLIYTAVNLGSLGFMADVPVDDIETYLKDLKEKKYTVDKRIMLEGTTPQKQTFHAANDFVFHRGAITNMIQLKVTINNDPFNTFVGDGIILSTPTGSSAYSLACGGPLMHPNLKAFVLTTISGHTLTNRPFVIPADSVIRVEYMHDGDEEIDVIVDGIDSFPMKAGQVTELRASPDTFYLINYLRHNFYHTVRLKLHWKGKSSP